MSDVLDPRDLAVLPVDELGIWLLRTLRNEYGRTFNRGPTLTSVLRGVGERMPSDKVYAASSDPDDVPHVAKALAEAWDWLAISGVIAEAVAGMLGMPLEGYYFITRYGERVATHERPREWISAERRLGMTLHPRLEERARRQFVMGEF